MKKIIILIISFILYGCSVVGNQLGKVVDKTTGEDKYQEQYTREGLEEDVEILKEIFTREEQEEIDNRACKEPGTHQVCTYNKGCWCEKT